MTKNGRPQVVSPQSETVGMFTWLSRPSVCASKRILSSARASAVNSGLRSFTTNLLPRPTWIAS